MYNSKFANIIGWVAIVYFTAIVAVQGVHGLNSLLGW